MSTSRARVTPAAILRLGVWDTGWVSVRTILDRAGLVALASIGLVLGAAFATQRLIAIDSTVFWSAGHSPEYYSPLWTCVGGCSYLYSPPFAQLVGLLSWPAFIIPWTLLLFVGWWGSTRSWSLPTFVGSVLVVAAIGYGNPFSNPLDQTAIGNPQILIAAVCVIGFRYPAAWAFVLLTKVAPGVGVLWFAVRHEWRNLGIALGVTAAVVCASVVVAPGAWGEYLRFITANADAASPVPVVPIPFIVRFPMSVALIAWGARTDRRWTVPIAVGWASLALYEWTFITIWMAALVLVDRPLWRAPAPDPRAQPAV
jgi:hypothetical protein